MREVVVKISMADCRGVCARWPGAVRGAKYVDSMGRRYAYCKTCNMSFPVESLTVYDSAGRLLCPCCKRVVRHVPRKPRSKMRYLVRFEPLQAKLYAR